MSTPPGPQDWSAGQPSWAPYAGLPPAGVPRGTDSTRVMAIVALVVSGLALLAVVVAQLLPALMFGALGGLGSDGPPAGSDAVGGFSGTTYRGVVVVAKDGTVAAGVLASAVEAAAPGELLGTLSCDPAPKAVTGVSTLCRSMQLDQISSYAVVQFTDDTGHFQAMTFTYGSPGAFPSPTPP